MNSIILAIDIGNTMAHVGLVDMSALSCIASASIPSTETCKSLGTLIDGILEREGIDRLLNVNVCSVSRYTFAEIESFAGKSLLAGKIRQVSWHDSLPVKFNYDNPSLLGTDRIADCLYAAKAFPFKNTIIIDAGTAVTVDFLSDKCVFEGGTIIPGIRAQFCALNKATARLPDASEHIKPVNLPGRNTEDCMIAGVTIGLAGAVDGLINRYFELYGECVVIACGGAWKQLGPLVRSKVVYKPECTLVGTGLFA